MWRDAARLGYISIHALLAESDIAASCTVCPSPWHFYPRSPCGERRPEYFFT